MAFIEMDFASGGGVSDLPTFYTSATNYNITSSEHNKTYTATKDCILYGNLELSYNTSGYIRVKLNNDYVINSTTKSHYYPFIKMKKDDIVTIEYDSNSNSTYSVAY